MSNGVNEGTVLVNAKKNGKRFGQLEGGTSVAWLVCDGANCNRYRVMDDAGDTEALVRDAIEEGWECNDDGDFCYSCVAPSEGA
jgi:hypothetical protein